MEVKVFLEKLDGLVQELKESLGKANCLSELEEIRVKFFSRKKGYLSEVMKGLKELAPSDLPIAGRKANEVKQELLSLVEEKKHFLEKQEKEAALRNFDPTIPGRKPDIGTLHPITVVIEEISDIFTSLGFEVVQGPEVETDFYNFEALNIPPEHPARDMQDSLYITEKTLLRTHTSPLQIRTMLSRKPPIAAIAPGKVYRRDSDLTHSPMFHQIEGFLVDKHVTMADLRGILTLFLHRVFGPETRVRFRPSFFPFTEPSAEVDISCVMCKGSGKVNGETCRVCKETGWVEILGCGMIDPAVFKMVGYDSEKFSGFAFGLGVERVAMLKYGIGDLRIFFENDIRFLQQFK
ncbi:phenylalanyl-tRNA synthetase, alpha subunit [Desulfonauticus submarinus]|uniref:Phenylalanine--tRNA ligase alpha subunit n=1 Tax=Desulfonauticus submarinus TaxID=206665 RepID=A0A1H0BJM4_9BACT|nr:phenylalanine--tRNA ligase subunit alpha [Desulfonauticus submarinus]SDN45791.1 phenylalanyl-tRNA synthetase, alpha subunit [Desulfonauticus submarinus]